MLDPRKLLPHILGFLHQVIITTEPLLELAASKESHLKSYFIKHLEEERGHDKWLAEDLKSIGLDVNKIPYDSMAAALAGSQYYIINHVNPVGFLGYMLFLEGHPMDLNLVSELEEIYGRMACRTLRYHAENDIDHGSELMAIVETLSQQERDLIEVNRQQTLFWYSLAMKNIEVNYGTI